MVCFNLFLPMYGLMLVQPLMELCGAMIAIVLYNKLKNSPNVTQKATLG